MSWLPRDPSQTLSDVDPQPVGDTPSAGTSGETSRDNHVHTLGTLTTVTFESPDGTLWTVTVDNTGALTTTELDVLTTEAGDFLTTEAGGLLLAEG